MRVIAGSARRLLLKTAEGMDTRPTTDRIKETLFNMLQNDLFDCSFLDLFAGSGAIGIEALSRGAREAVFIDSGSKQVACIRENLKTTKLTDRARILECPVLSGLSSLNREGLSFDFIFMDPPYDMGHEKAVCEVLSHSGLLNPQTLIIAEVSLKTDVSWAEDLGFTVVRVKEYKTNKHIFLKKA